MAEAQTTQKRTSWPRFAKSNGKKACTVEGCKRPYRAKNYCYFHYKQWRQGDLPHSRYRTCSKPECRVKTFKGGLCEKHHGEAFKKDAA